ncbi:MAG: FAD-dependent oxidoreductase, partial [Armatimonadetes bacterium]|nr:FAD-dependent oxidoreductase [Armatimonadota bacterium]
MTRFSRNCGSWRSNQALGAAAALVALVLGPVSSAETVTVRPGTPDQISRAIGRVSMTYAESARPPKGTDPALRLLFVGGPGGRGQPAAVLPARPEGILPADLSGAREFAVRMFNASGFPVSVELELRFSNASVERQAMLSDGHWRRVSISLSPEDVGDVRLAEFRELVVRPVARHAQQLCELYIDTITVEWEKSPPRQPPVGERQVAWGQAGSLPPTLSPQGNVRWAGMSVPVVARCDVLVAGGGLAGCAAAVSAARMGASVILVERTGALGGMATSGYVPPAMRPELSGGIVAEFVHRLNERGGPDQNRHPEVMKAVLLEMLRESGAKLLLYTTAVAPLMHKNRVEGLIVHGKSGFQAIRARVVVDCTGDADIAALAGVPFQMGRGRDKQTQAVTLMFLLGNVDTNAFCGSGIGAVTTPYYQRAVEEGWWKIPHAGPAWCEVVVRGPHGVINVNCMNVGMVDGLNPADLTYAHAEALDVAWQLVEFFRRYVPGCAECYLVSSASLLGVRETRRILGEYVLTARDVLSSAVFPDGIARGFYPIDIHPADDTGDAGGARPPGPYEIPYRCLVPRGVDNILVAGRPISVDHVAHGSTRVQGTTMALGEAAGVAAALSCQLGVSPRNLDGKLVREKLEAAGAMPRLAERVPDNPALWALGTQVYVDSCHTAYPDSARGAIDGLVAIGSSSRWVSGEAEEPHWIELHFPRAVNCSAVTL